MYTLLTDNSEINFLFKKSFESRLPIESVEWIILYLIDSLLLNLWEILDTFYTAILYLFRNCKAI